MDQAGEWSSLRFVEVVLIWTAYGRDIMPRRNDAEIIACFGADAAAGLLPMIRALMDAFYESDAKDTAGDLVEMGRMATEDFKARYPEVGDEVLEALSWCYTFDFK